MNKIKIKTKLLMHPVIDVINLEEAKLYLRVTNNKEDSLIISLIKAVRNLAEDYLKMSLVTRELQAHIGGFFSGSINLPRGPVQKIDSIYAIKVNGQKNIVDSLIYNLDSCSDKIEFRCPLINSGLIINYTAGYEKILDIPDAIKQGMLTHLANIYDDRASGKNITKTILDYYQPYRKLLI